MARTPLYQKIIGLIQKAAVQIKGSSTDVEDISRRDFIKSAVVTSVALPAISLLSLCAHSRRPDSIESPVVILGAGIAGLTAAYHLAQASIPCVIYEASPRVGGRMFTKSKFNKDDMTCELGGELIDTNHTDIIALCKEMGIELDLFAPGDAGLTHSLYYFNKKYYTDEKLIPLFQPFAKKIRRDQKKLKSESFANQLDHLTLEQYLSQFRGVEKWIIEMIKVAYIGEFGLEASEQSALSMLYTLSPETKDGFKIYGDSDEAMKIRGGNISLIKALEDFVKSKGVTIYTQSPVVKLEELSTGIQINFAGEVATKKIVTKKVICTIPFSVLRNIEGVSKLAIDPLKKKSILELGYGTCSKMMFGFQKKIWRRGLKKASVVIPASNGMVYTDLPTQTVWETSRTQRGDSGILTSFNGGTSGATLEPKQREDYSQYLDEIFPGTKTISDGNFAMMNWSKMPFNQGAYASPKPGQVVAFGAIDWTPDLSGQLIFAGEHVADQSQGYMNGACRSGKRAAEFIRNSIAEKNQKIKL